MKRATLLTVAALALLAPAPAALAGVYTDDLSKCLVKSASATDQIQLMQWMFALIALNPAVKPNAAITADQREGFDRQAAALMSRLLVTDCHKEAVGALKYEGTSSLEASFKVLGEVAIRGLMADPSVAGGLQAFSTYIDKDQFAALGREAGVDSEPADKIKN